MKILLFLAFALLCFASCNQVKPKLNDYRVFEICDSLGCRPYDYKIQSSRASRDTIAWVGFGNGSLYRAVRIK